MKTKTTKFMTLMTVSALGIFSAGTVMAAGNNDFYTQPPAGSAWEKADTEGTYASYTNGSDYVNIYKYSLEDVKTGIAKCNDTYEACYQTIYSEGNSLYMAVGYAKDAGDIGDVRKFVEYISYPGNPSLTREADENAAGNSDKSETGTSGQKSGGETNSSDSDTEKNASVSSSDSSDDSDIRTTSPMTLVDSDGNTIEINYILHKDYSCEYRGDDGMEYTDNGDETYTDENGNTYTALSDAIFFSPCQASSDASFSASFASSSASSASVRRSSLSLLSSSASYASITSTRVSFISSREAIILFNLASFEETPVISTTLLMIILLLG